MGSYIPTTDTQKKEMLDAIGVDSIDALFEAVPQSIRLTALDLPSGKSELTLSAEMNALAQKNKVFPSIFRGAGAYRHYIPAVVSAITSNETFVTAYTPYQAEMSQGLLQSIFEYQTEMCELTGMDASNASVYDGATAAAEAVAMCRDKKRNCVLVSPQIKPDTLAVIRTYCFGNGMEVILADEKDGLTALGEKLNGEIACVYLEQPNYLGLLEDVPAIADAAHAVGAKLIVGCNPISLGILATPAEQGADIAVGEGQPLGLPLGFGGPYLGFMTCKNEMVRKLPGRIVGETVDSEGNRAFVLTLQAREQHIRREKASSNICSNEALCAMTAAVYLSAMGADGLREVALQCTSKAHYFAEKLQEIRFKLPYNGEFFHEFVTETPVSADKILEILEKNGILGGLKLGENTLLWCVTEMNTAEEIDRVVSILREVIA